MQFIVITSVCAIVLMVWYWGNMRMNRNEYSDKPSQIIIECLLILAVSLGEGAFISFLLWVIGNFFKS